MSVMTEKAFELVEDIFKDKLDKGGHPYINHLIRVSSKMKNESDKTIALLHDAIEDADITKDELEEIGFPSYIAETVHIVSRKETETYSEFIDRIIDSNNVSAVKVKIADLEDNMDLSRISNPSQKDFDRIKKRYKPAYTKLKNKLKQME